MEYPSPVSENDVHVTIYLWVYIVYNYSESCSRVGRGGSRILKGGVLFSRRN